jgi:hypothetical protein
MTCEEFIPAPLSAPPGLPAGARSGFLSTRISPDIELVRCFVGEDQIFSPSLETVEALGRALLLDTVELARLHRFVAAGNRQPFQRVRRCPTRFAAFGKVCPYTGPPHRTALGHPGWERRCHNAVRRLQPARQENRNILHWMLTDPASKSLFGRKLAEEARRMVPLFRAVHDLWAAHGLLR